MRADIYLVEYGFAESRNKASRLILDGKALIDGRPVKKPSEDVEGEHQIEILEEERYVGRGGLKLEGAIDSFSVDVTGKRCIDVGASTGGFTDCLLQRGASFVCAIDSGRGQLHSRLLSDIRVTSIEGFNARDLTPDKFGCFDIAVTDVSFISQTLLHGPISSVLNDGGLFISLIKPQFEAGKSALGKNGIVKKPQDRIVAVNRVVESAALYELGLVGLIRSPIEGGDGNREYLALFKKGYATEFSEEFIKKLTKNLCAD